jgi:myotubularin-related protein 6/7/8
MLLISLVTAIIIYFITFQVLNSHVASTQKLPLLSIGSPLRIKCKHFFVVTFIIPKERDCHEVFLTLLRLSFPSNA